jgi:ABC-type nitrate/sulfonate/bicarbonate transport system substrate-binding protein
MRRFTVAAALALVPIFFAAACGHPSSGDGASAGQAGAPVDFKIAYGATSATNIPIYLGIENGIFTKYGLNVSMVLLPGTKAPPALATNSVQLTQSGVSDMAGAIVAGSPFTISAVPYPWMFFQLFGQKGMTSVGDLKGKTIAASSAGASSDTAINIAMKDSGLVRGKDYNVVYIGDNGPRMAALQQGVVNAIVVSPPTAQLVAQQGFPDLNDMIAEKIPYGYGSFGVNKAWAAAHKDTMVKFFQAYAESVNLGKNDKEAAYAVEKKDLGLTDQKIIESVYDVSIAVMPDYPVTQAETIKATTTNSQNQKVVQADPNALFDNSYVQTAQAAAK